MASPRRSRRRAPGQLCCIVLSGLLLLSGLGSAAAKSERSSATARVKARAGAKDHGEDRALAAAQRLQGEGAAALQAGKLPEATRLLTAAYRAAPSPQGLYLLGKLALAEGRELDAHDLFRRYLADPDLEREAESDKALPPPAAVTAPAAPSAPAAPAAPAALAAPSAAPPAAATAAAKPESAEAAAIREAERFLAQPRPPAGTLNILGERGTLIFVDGRLVGTLPLSLPLLIAPSEHKVILERGNQRIEDQVQIAAGRLGELRSDVSSRALLLSILPGVLLFADFASLPPELRARLQQSLEQALLSRRRSPLPSELALTFVPALAPRLQACIKDTACQVELATQVEADAVLLVSSEAKDGKLRLRVGLLNTTVGEEAAGEEQSCDKCSVEQAGLLLREQVGRVYEAGSARGQAQLSVRCDPADAELSVDARPIPGGRFFRAVFAGPHRLRLQQAGLPPSERTITLRDGEAREELMRLAIPEPPPAPLVLPPPPPLPPRRPTWRLAVGGVALAGGLVLVGFGAAMLSLDGRCVLETSLPGEQCERLYETTIPGGAVLGTGLAVAITGTVLLAWPPTKPRR